MELNLDEQKLMAEYRRLPQEGKNELCDLIAHLLKKYRTLAANATPSPGNQCELGKKEELRPEAAEEPIFTE